MKEEAKILIVDDDRDFVEISRATLESKGYQVVPAYNGKEGLEKALKEDPDLIVLDVMMEKLDDGFSVCRELKNDPELKKIPVLMVTGITQKTGLKFSPLTDGEYLPAEDLMDKPIKPTALLKRVENLLNRGESGKCK